MDGQRRAQLLGISSIQEAGSGGDTSVPGAVPPPVRGGQATGVGRSDDDVLHVPPGERRAGEGRSRE